jgi:hypothetical protein
MKAILRILRAAVAWLTVKPEPYTDEEIEEMERNGRIW